MKNSNDNLEIAMTVGQKNQFPDFINLQLWASKGAFKITNLSQDFTSKVTTPPGATGGTISGSTYISADGTTPSDSGGHTNAPAAHKLSGVINHIVEIECITAGIVSVILES